MLPSYKWMTISVNFIIYLIVNGQRQAEGKIVVPRLRYPRHKTLLAASLVVRTKQLAADLGGYDKLKELIEVLK